MSKKYTTVEEVAVNTPVMIKFKTGMKLKYTLKDFNEEASNVFSNIFAFLNQHTYGYSGDGFTWHTPDGNSIKMSFMENIDNFLTGYFDDERNFHIVYSRGRENNCVNGSNIYSGRRLAEYHCHERDGILPTWKYSYSAQCPAAGKIHEIAMEDGITVEEFIERLKPIAEDLNEDIIRREKYYENHWSEKIEKVIAYLDKTSMTHTSKIYTFDEYKQEHFNGHFNPVDEVLSEEDIEKKFNEYHLDDYDEERYWKDTENIKKKFYIDYLIEAAVIPANIAQEIFGRVKVLENGRQYNNVKRIMEVK